MTAADARRPSNDKSSSSKPQSSQGDGYYGHESTAKMSAAFITSLFACPELPPPSTNVNSSGQPVPSPKLAQFIAYALHRTRLSPCVTFAALFLLQRLKNRFPAARGSSGHRLFISAFMIASKVVCDDTYSNKSWAVVGQGMFQLREINQMEREMCGYLEWHLNIDYLELEAFTEKTQLEFGSGVAVPQLPVTASLAPAPTKAAPPSATASRLTPSYDDGAHAGSPATLITTAGDEDEEIESPSNSLTSSPASSALQTPPSNADIDGRDEAGVVVASATQTSSGGITSSSVATAAAALAQKAAANAVGASEAAKIKATLDRGRAAFASAARW